MMTVTSNERRRTQTTSGGTKQRQTGYQQYWLKPLLVHLLLAPWLALVRLSKIGQTAPKT